MGKTIILGNNPQDWWIKDIRGAEVISVPEISIGRNLDITNYILTLPMDADCIVIDADSLNTSNIELPLDLILHIRLMLHECRKFALSKIVCVTELGIETYKGYGAKSMVLMTQNVAFATKEEACFEIENSRSMTPAEYVLGFLELIKIEPQEKVEGRHSIANEWGADALYNVISEGKKSSIISVKATSSLYFKYSSVVSLNAEDVRMIIEGEVSQFLTNKINIPDRFSYLLIDDEADKGWAKVLKSLLPNAAQELWSDSINSYEELSQNIRNKISDGYYALIFLDLRMAGVAEENVLKPQDFSGMKILESIKAKNEGIQVIMLTATNKAWNVKALLDAGANGYYMKESPEYHFSLKYSEQNALALVDTIKDCLKNSYLQDIVAELNGLDLPLDSELSYHINSQLSIARSLILKAKTESEYAFAYISLEQVFEIASSSLIHQELEGNAISYYFTEDTEERCRLYQDGIPQGFLTSFKGGAAVAQWKKIAAIYYQLFGGKDRTFGSRVENLISLRNQYIHPQKENKPRITIADYKDLFETVIDFLELFK